MTVRFTAVEGVPGVRLQHIRSVLHGTASPQTLELSLRWETDVTGQGLGDVVHTVHLQIGLVCKNTEETQSEAEMMKKREGGKSLFLLMTDEFDLGRKILCTLFVSQSS